MKYSFLVASREYIENASTKGFWIGIVTFPIILVISLQATTWLAKAVPTRHFVLIDQTDSLGPTVDEALNRIQQRRIINELATYAKKHSRAANSPDKKTVDLESIPAIDQEQLIEELTSTHPETIDKFIKNGGVKFALKLLRPMLVENAPEFEEPRPQFQRVDLPEGIDPKAALPQIASDLKPYLRGQKSVPGTDGDDDIDLFAAILIPPDIEKLATQSLLPKSLEMAAPKGIQYWSSNLADDDLEDEIGKAINREIRRRQYVASDVNPDTVRRIQRLRAPLSKLNPKKDAGKEQVSMADIIRQWAPVGFVYLLWIGVFTISQMLLNNTIEEKSNRIIEVLLSSVTPRELMLGKLFGIAAVGLTIIGSWMLSLVGLLWIHSGPEAEFATQLFQVLQTSHLLPLFAVYFLLGYLMYAGVFLAIGSVCNTLKEAQNLMGPVMIIMIVPLFTMMFIPKDPNGTLATILSWIPLYTPFIMMNRAAADPPTFDLYGTLILMVVSTLLVLWLTGRIFRVGILRTGQPPKILEIFRWIRSKA